MFVADNNFHPSLILADTAGSVDTQKFHSDGRPQALPANIRLGWKWLTVKNTLPSYDTKLIMAVKNYYTDRGSKLLNKF